MNIMLVSENRRLLMTISHYFRGLASCHLDIVHSSPAALESFAENQPEGESMFRQDLMQDGAVDCFDAAYESLLISGIVQ